MNTPDVHNADSENTAARNTAARNTVAENPQATHINHHDEDAGIGANAPTPAGEARAAHPRPLGFWLKITERALSHEFEAAFASAGITRRDWRVLNALTAAGSAPAEETGDHGADRDRLSRDAGMAARIAERIARKPHSVHTLADLGWVAERNGSWVITDTGLAARAELTDALGVIRSRITDAVPAEDLATTIASLEAIAREFGWDESQPGPHRGGRKPFGRGTHGGPRPFGGGEGRGPQRPEFGPNLHHGFGPGRGDAPANGHRDESRRDTPRRDGHRSIHDSDRGAHPGTHRGHRRHEAERAFERGFEAGFTRGTQSAA